MTEQIIIEYRPSLFSPPRSGPWVVGKITFIPGVKGYLLSDWEEAQKNPRLKGFIESALAENILRIISKTTQKQEIPKLPANQQEAIATVGRTYSQKLLLDWKTIEKRKAVIEAIDAQLTADTEKTEKKTTTTPKQLSANAS